MIAKTTVLQYWFDVFLLQIPAMICPYSTGSPLSSSPLSSSSSWHFLDPLPIVSMKITVHLTSNTLLPKIDFNSFLASQVMYPRDPRLVQVKNMLKPRRVWAFDGIVNWRPIRTKGVQFFNGTLQRIAVAARYLCLVLIPLLHYCNTFYNKTKVEVHTCKDCPLGSLQSRFLRVKEITSGVRCWDAAEMIPLASSTSANGPAST